MTVPIRVPLVLPALVLGMLAPASFGQSVLHTFYGDSPEDWLGYSVSGAGDVNGDGFADLIVGARRDDNNGPLSGSARVFSGVDGSILYTFDGDAAIDIFGHSVSGAGDVNGDGFDDVVVGAPGDDNNGDASGSARVFSGLDGSVIYTFDGDSPGALFGYSVSGAGDVNGDGFDDLIVGAYTDDTNGLDSGSARVFSGVDGGILYTVYGDSEGDGFGWSVSGADDVNADGFDDVIVGAPGDDNNDPNSGSARVFSGVDGSILYTFDGDSWSGHFGWSVSGAGDVNGDGFADLIVGAPDDGGGSARVFSGVDGSVLYTFEGDFGDFIGDHFGQSVSGAGDVNRDGFADLIVGAPYDKNGKLHRRGTAWVFSGFAGSVLYAFDGDSADDAFGFSVSGAGDVNRDGFADVIVGAPLDKKKDRGSAWVFSGGPALGTTYCTPAEDNSSGHPAEIRALGSDVVADNRVHLTATHLPANRFGYFLASETRGFIEYPRGSRGDLCLGGHIGRFGQQVLSTGPGGSFTLQVDLTSIPTDPPHSVVPGETWNFQAWFRDMDPLSTSNFTDAVSVLFE